MNQKNFVILIVAVVLVLGLTFAIKGREQKDWQSKPAGTPDRVLPNFPLNDVSQIKIETKDKVLTLRKEGESWSIGEREGYPANFQLIGNLLRKMWDLKPVQTVTAGESQYPRLEVAQPKAEKGGGTLVEFSNAAPVASLILGKMHQSAGESGPYGSYPDGRYLLVPSGKQVYLVSETLSEIEPDPTSWINRDFLQVSKIKSIQVANKDGVTWELSRDKEGEAWKLAGLKENEKLDATKTSTLDSLFSSFSDVAGKRANVKDPFTDWTQILYTTFEGFTYKFFLGSEKDGNRYVTVDVSAEFPKERVAAEGEKPEDKQRLDDEFKKQQETLQTKLTKEQKFAEWVYLLPSSSLESLLKPRAELLAAEKKEEAVTAPVGTDPAP